MANEVFSAEAAPNIAFIKYWGKQLTGQNLPNNSSISMTLDQHVVNTKTSVMLSADLAEDRLFINNELQDISSRDAQEKSKYIFGIINDLRKRTGIDSKVLIVSQNSFPTGSGIASSASGAVALVEALAPAFGLSLTAADKSDIARRISGSACRSSFGGIVRWNVGTKVDGSDSHAEQVFTEGHWPELLDLITIVDESKKKVSSSQGHMLTPKTSILYRSRIPFAEEGVRKVVDALRERDLNKFAELIMRDSNNMHATMLDTWPPIMYLNDISRNVMFAIHELNAAKGANIAGYTFDAGANPHILTTDQYKEEVLRAVSEISGVKRVLESHAGSGPRVLTSVDSLIDPVALGPKNAPRKLRS